MERIFIKKSLRILYVVHGFPPKDRAGTELHTYYFSKELAKKNEVHVFFPKKINSYKVINSYKQGDLYLHEYVTKDKFLNKFSRAYAFLFLKNTYTNKFVEFTFKELINKIKPDIIHFEHLISLSIRLIEIANKFNIPSVITLHDFWFICPNINLLNNNFEICNGPNPEKCRSCWINERSNILSNGFKNYILSKLFDKFILEIFLKLFNPCKEFQKRNIFMKSMLFKTNTIISPSNFLRKKFIKFGIPEKKIIYSENGISHKSFKGFKKEDSDIIRFGYAGGIHPAKGLDTLIDVFNRINNSIVELNIYGRINIKSNYHKLILAKAKDNSKINFMGEYNDLREPYSNIDVLIVPSKCYETGGPLVIKESFFTKTPVIASNIGCISEFVKDNINGLLFEIGNSSDLADKMQTICDNKELITEFKKNILSVKSIKEQAEEIIRIYRGILNREN